MRVQTAAKLAISTYVAIVLGSLAVGAGIWIGIGYVLVHFLRKVW